MAHDAPSSVVGPAGDIPLWSGSMGSWRLSLSRRPFEAAELAQHYDRKAAQWDATINQYRFDAAYARLALAALPHIAPARPLRVLDAGIGTGAFAAAFAREWAAPIDLTGLDISPRMLDQARQRLHRDGLTPRLMQGNLQAIPCPDSSVDLVLAAHVLEHLPDPATALSECHRILAPGGLVIAAITRDTVLGAAIQLMWRTHRASPRRARHWFDRAGFRDLQVVPFGSRTASARLSLGYLARKPMVTNAADGTHP